MYQFYGEVPEGWEPAYDYLRCPEPNEFFIRDDGQVVKACVRIPMLAIVVRPLNKEVLKPWGL